MTRTFTPKASLRPMHLKESAALTPKLASILASPSDSEISVSNILETVNNVYLSILSKSVLKEFGHKRRTDLERIFFIPTETLPVAHSPRNRGKEKQPRS